MNFSKIVLFRSNGIFKSFLRQNRLSMYTSIRFFSKDLNEENVYDEPSLVNPFGSVIEQDSSQEQPSPENISEALPEIETSSEGYIPNLMSESDLVGLSTFKQGINMLSEFKFKQAEKSFKMSLKEIKENKQERSLAYCHVLNRLAYTSVKLYKLEQAEKYLIVCNKIARILPEVEDNGFIFYINLLNFYIQYDLERAKELANEMLEIDFSIDSLHRIKFSIGNIHCLSDEYDEAIKEYQKVLKLFPKPILKAQLLNNMAMTNIYRSNSIKEREKTYDEQQGYKYIISNFKEAMQLFETLNESEKEGNDDSIELQISSEVLNDILNQDNLIPDYYTPEKENQFFGHMKNMNSAKVITNL